MKSVPAAFCYFCFGTVLGSSCRQLTILTLFSSGFFSMSVTCSALLHRHWCQISSLQHFPLVQPTNSGWDGVNLLHSSPYGAVLWICAETVLTTRHSFANCWAALAQDQGFFFPTLPPPPVGRLGMDKRLGSNIATTADPNWIKRYSIPYDITLSNKSSGKGGWKRAFMVLMFAFPGKCHMC